MSNLNEQFKEGICTDVREAINTDLRNEEAFKVCKSIKAYMEEYTDEFWGVISWIAL